MNLEYIKDLIQSCHINFLIGSGVSRPFLGTLGNIETLLTDLSKREDLDNDKRQLIKASIYKLYFEDVMWPNYLDYKFKKLENGNKIGTEKGYIEVLRNYENFMIFLNEILLYRYSSILNKQINLFTTNIDLFIEKAIEKTKLEFNDGFIGRIDPSYDLSNFQKSYYKTSLHYENKSEIPVFNILKVHGSLNWEKNTSSNDIFYSHLNHVKTAYEQLKKININKFLTITDKSTIDTLIDETISIEFKINTYDKFLSAYEKILVINPTKEKFKRTLIDDKFYELLRIYANSLEKENSLLFVLGFSFADEHIRDITLRAANSNPTLQIIIFAFNEKAKTEIENELQFTSQKPKNNNIIVFSPTDFNSTKKDSTEFFDFTNILKFVFKPIVDLIRLKDKA